MAKPAQTRDIETQRGPFTIAVFEGNGGGKGEPVFLDVGDGQGVVGEIISSDAGWSFARIKKDDGSDKTR